MRPPALIRQADRYGCAIACTAMVTGLSYETVRDDWGGAGTGHGFLTWSTYLANRGYATQHLWKHNSERKADRDPWPLEPWADIHLCAVDAGFGQGSHLVVLLRDGTVLDPATDEPRRLSDYKTILHMTAVISVSAHGEA
jgi:hypothetical protein